MERVSDDRFSEDGRTEEYVRIAVFLSVLDVHVNRAPVAGRVVDYFLEDGGFAAAMTTEGSTTPRRTRCSRPCTGGWRWRSAPA